MPWSSFVATLTCCGASFLPLGNGWGLEASFPSNEERIATRPRVATSGLFETAEVYNTVMKITYITTTCHSAGSGPWGVAWVPFDMPRLFDLLDAFEDANLPDLREKHSRLELERLNAWKFGWG